MGLKCLLASMDGMSHAAFRSICFGYGADGATTEMIPALACARAKKRRLPVLDALMLRGYDERNLAAQIIGNQPEIMAMAANRLESLSRFDAIEINMGCPARAVVGSGNGSALLRDVRLAERILYAVCEAVRLPVRLKLRLGWDDGSITAPEIAAIAQAAGCREIILHGRTRSQMYSGGVQLEQMLRVREAVRIPIYANGAVEHAGDASSFAAATHADGVCIGRAALKNPWIFDDIRCLEAGKLVPERNAAERVGLLLRLAEGVCRQKPEEFAICEMRKFCRWYLSGLSGADVVCGRMNAVSTLDGFRRELEGYLNGLVRADDTRVHPELEPAWSLDTVCRGQTQSH